MSDPYPHVRVLFRTDLVRVLDYRCAGHDNDGEVPHSFEIGLPRKGAYQRRDRHGTFLADPNQVLFYNKGEPYDIRHPVQGGDSSTVRQYPAFPCIYLMQDIVMNKKGERDRTIGHC